MVKDLKEWENKTLELTNYFIERYFGKKENVEYYWIADDIGGCLAVNDYFFSLSDMVEYIKYHYSKDMMFKYYDYRLSYETKKSEGKLKLNDYLINIKNYKKLK